jgi:hypothetical protein
MILWASQPVHASGYTAPTRQRDPGEVRGGTAHATDSQTFHARTRWCRRGVCDRAWHRSGGRCRPNVYEHQHDHYHNNATHTSAYNCSPYHGPYNCSLNACPSGACCPHHACDAACDRLEVEASGSKRQPRGRLTALAPSWGSFMPELSAGRRHRPGTEAGVGAGRLFNRRQRGRRRGDDRG